MAWTRMLWATVALAWAASSCAVSLPAAHADDLAEEAARQLGEAESELAAGHYLRAVDSAASAFRLDGSLRHRLHPTRQAADGAVAISDGEVARRAHVRAAAG